MSRKLELIVLSLVLIFAAVFFYISSTTNAEFGGADDKPEGVIEEITGGTYKPIAEPVWEPPSGEIESLIFALQAAIGAGILGYFFGYYRAKSRFEKKSEYKGRKSPEGDGQSL
ncbi:Cobalt transport protein CbiN [bioreactor metagenome]|uniref:Cobalt transport protein CbiN n=1 Tax=bioreactor metagenome TaxID=1076179 RepID=A0A645H479_9ZZZZ